MQWQQVEEGRANVLGTLTGTGGGPSLMLNGHMDTSYSGREPWLRTFPASSRSAFVEDGRLYGLGISNMKGALACYVEALRALDDAGVRLRGDVLVAAVSGEIEKRSGRRAGRRVRGYAQGPATSSPTAASRTCASSASRRSPKIVLGHFGSCGCGSRRAGPSSTPRSARASATRTRWSGCATSSTRCSTGSRLGERPENAYRGAKAIVNVGAIEGGFGWRVSRTPHRADLFLDVRVPPTKEMATARGQVLDLVRDLAKGFPEHGIEGEVYVTAPGAEIAEEHPLVGALDDAHAEVFGSAPERDVTRWFSDASVLTRYGIATVNYGTSTGLLDTVKGENLEIEGLVKTAEVYARVAMKVCGVA